MRVLVVGMGVAEAALALTVRAADAEVVVSTIGVGEAAFERGVVTGELAEGLASVFVPLPDGTQLANVLGEAVEAAFALPHQARGAIAPGASVDVIGLRRAPQLFDAEWAAEALRARGIDARARELRLSLSAGEVRRTPFDWANALEDPGEQERFGEGLRALELQTDRLALLPPIVGHRVATLDKIVARVGHPLAELVPTVPSVPGLRLAVLLERRLEEAGCRVVRGRLAELREGSALLSSGERIAFDRIAGRGTA